MLLYPIPEDKSDHPLSRDYNDDDDNRSDAYSAVVTVASSTNHGPASSTSSDVAAVLGGNRKTRDTILTDDEEDNDNDTDNNNNNEDGLVKKKDKKKRRKQHGDDDNKNNKNKEQRRSRRRQKRRLRRIQQWQSWRSFVVLGIVLVAAVTIVVVIMTQTTGGSSTTTTLVPSSSPTIQPTISPAPTITPFPTMPPSIDPEILNTLNEWTNELLVPLTTTNNNNNTNNNNDDLFHPPQQTKQEQIMESSRERAYNWILTHDLYRDEILTDSTKIRWTQRFVLALLFYCMQFNNNNNVEMEQLYLLAEKSECEWPGITCNQDVIYIQQNDDDNNDNEVSTTTDTVEVVVSVVRRIEWTNVNAIGILPPELRSLIHLQEFNVTFNSLQGYLPKEWFEKNKESGLHKIQIMTMTTMTMTTNIIFPISFHWMYDTINYKEQYIPICGYYHHYDLSISPTILLQGYYQIVKI